MMIRELILKNRNIIVYGLAMAILLFLLKWLEIRFIIVDYAFEVYSAAIAIIFTALGIWLALKLVGQKVHTVYVEKEIQVPDQGSFQVNSDEITRLGLSKRELEVLQLMATGLSNNEIAEKMFISPNTIKTHCSRIFEKLEVSRRTQAVEKARRLMLIG